MVKLRNYFLLGFLVIFLGGCNTPVNDSIRGDTGEMSQLESELNAVIAEQSTENYTPTISYHGRGEDIAKGLKKTSRQYANFWRGFLQSGKVTDSDLGRWSQSTCKEANAKGNTISLKTAAKDFDILWLKFVIDYSRGPNIHDSRISLNEAEKIFSLVVENAIKLECPKMIITE